METLVIVIVVVSALVAVGVSWWMRRRANPRQGDSDAEVRRMRAEPRRLAPPPEPQVLDRDTVLGRTRVFDPTKWDDTPDGSEEDGTEESFEDTADGPGDEDLPQYFDREYLERKNRGEAPEA